MASINNLVSSALRAAEAYNNAIDALREQLKAQIRKGDKAVRAALLPGVAAHFGIKVVQGERGDRLDDEHPNYEAAKTSLRRLVGSVLGNRPKGAPEKVTMRLNKGEQALVLQLSALPAARIREIAKRAIEAAKAAA